jgi:hypothetical protein
MLKVPRLARKFAIALIAVIALCCVPHAGSRAAAATLSTGSAHPTTTSNPISDYPISDYPRSDYPRSEGSGHPATAVSPISDYPRSERPDRAAGVIPAVSRARDVRSDRESGAIPARTLAKVTPAAPAVPVAPAAPAGGICSVPGIGDIGGLLGFCSLGKSGLTGVLNNLCQPSVPEPESASSGIDSLVSPPAAPGKALATPYYEYGMAGQYWAATNLQCSDMTSLIGNDVAGMIFDFAKALDRVTITVYQSAAAGGILSWLQNVTDHLISGLGNAIYFPYVAVVVILGAIWLAWQGLVRKRGTRTIEGTIWMVVACAAAIWLIGRPADFTGLGKDVSDGISTTLNTAFAHLPSPGQATCVPVTGKDPQINPASYSYTSGRTVVDQNANELWTVLVCKPWLDGEFGTTKFAAKGKPQTVVNKYARSLLWSQAIAVNEQPTTALINAKQATYVGIAQSIQTSNPAVYPLFQGKEWTTRLEIAFMALLAALVAGVLILLISVTLILLKLGFLLLLIVGPFFLLIGTHPGFGRVVAVRWFEMLVGVLLKQAAVALALSVLLYCYALIMGTSDAVLPWALKILMITLVTVAVFIYRKPFQHLFASVGYSAIGASDRAEADLSRAAATARANTRDAATLAVPGFAAYRAARWARHNPAQAAGLAIGAATAVGTAGLASSVAAGVQPGGADAGDATAGAGGAGAGDPAAAGAAAQAGAAARARSRGASAGSAGGDQAPPLRLPASQATPASWTNGGGTTGANGGSPGRAGAAPPARVSGSASSSSGPAPALPHLGGAPGQRWPGSGSANGSAGGSGPVAGGPVAGGPVAGGGGAARPAASSGASPWTGGDAARAQRPATRPAAPPTSRQRSAAPPRSAAPRSAPPPRSSGSSGWSGQSGSAAPPRAGGGPFWSLGSRRQAPPPSSPPPSSPPSSPQPGQGPGGGGFAAGGSGVSAGGPGQAGGESQSSPFWLRPLRRRR